MPPLTINTEKDDSDLQASSVPSACPYAQAVNDESDLEHPLPGLVELKVCPAFRNQCPFKDAKSPKEISEKLQQIPASHLQNQGAFYKTLAFFHQQNNILPDDDGVQRSRSSGCPVKKALPNHEDWSFDQAMEEYSLAVVMSRLARDYENSIGEEGDGSSSSTGEEDDTPQSVRLRSPSSATASLIPSPLLSDALKTGTASAHEAAESVHFVKNFIRGKIDRQLYGLLVSQLYHLYNHLETALDKYAPQHFDACHFPKELHRTTALEEDVDFWHSTVPPISSATQDYMDRIDHLCKTNPLLLLSHAYTRYLGDLSGGKILARVAKRALHLDGGDGLAFYDFPHVPSFKLFKDKYRNSLNELKMSPSQIQALVQEANVAFLLNMRLFEELDVQGGLPNASVRPLESVYAMSKLSTGPFKENDGVDPASMECPFLVNKKNDKNLPPKGACPWPFILLHDPQTGLKAWQTWAAMGLLLLYLYQKMVTQGMEGTA